MNKYEDRAMQISLYSEILEPRIRTTKTDVARFYEDIFLSLVKNDGATRFYGGRNDQYLDMNNYTWIQYEKYADGRIWVSSKFLKIDQAFGLTKKQSERLVRKYANKYLGISRFKYMGYILDHNAPDYRFDILGNDEEIYIPVRGAAQMAVSTEIFVE